MKIKLSLLLLIVIVSCKNNSKEIISAQSIIDKSIELSGGELYKFKNLSFDFRDITYSLKRINGSKEMKRFFYKDSNKISDVKGKKFTRYINDSIVIVPDSIALKYSNSINSVLYFALLPYGLNDAAVNKEYLGEVTLKGEKYYKIKITFSKENGGDDYKDTYVYWFNKETYKPDYLAYKFFVNGGGMRFRVAYNERIINGIRFVDYENYTPMINNGKIINIDRLYENDSLVLLSKIELKNINLY